MLYLYYKQKPPENMNNHYWKFN